MNFRHNKVHDIIAVSIRSEQKKVAIDELASFNMNDWWKNWRSGLRKILTRLEEELKPDNTGFVVIYSFDF
jgi:hypothetical protein